MKNLIASIFIVIAFILLISEFDETNNTTTYILCILLIKSVGIITGYVGVELLTFKPNKS